MTTLLSMTRASDVSMRISVSKCVLISQENTNSIISERWIMAVSRISVLGLGQMGSALAWAFVKARQNVTVWNRSAGKAESLAAHGVSEVRSVGAAIVATDIIVVCLSSYQVAVDLIQDPDLTNSLKGKIIVNLTTGDAADARRFENWASDHGITYIDGAIMDYPSLVGTNNCLILLSGKKSAFESAATALAALGKLSYLGEDVASASLMDGALLTIYYSSAIGFMQSASMLADEGIDVGALGTALADFAPVLTNTFRRCGEMIGNRSYRGTEASIAVHAFGLQSLVARTDAVGGENALLKTLSQYLESATADGPADAELPVVYEQFRKGRP